MTKAYRSGVYYIWWKNKKAQLEQVEAVCRYLRGEVERLEAQVKQYQDFMGPAWPNIRVNDDELTPAWISKLRDIDPDIYTRRKG